jgi:hypothetical protein
MWMTLSLTWSACTWPAKGKLGSKQRNTKLHLLWTRPNHTLIFSAVSFILSDIFLYSLSTSSVSFWQAWFWVWKDVEIVHIIEQLKCHKNRKSIYVWVHKTIRSKQPYWHRKTIVRKLHWEDREIWVHLKF